MSRIGRSLGEQAYAEAFQAVQRALRRGESYEVNLTYQVRMECTADATELYRWLRRANPAPYAALLRLPAVSVLSSSPERFLRVGRNGTVEARPIKGTLPRGRDAAHDGALRLSLGRDPKTFAENLMITDLLRNDLGQVSQLGTIQVPALMVTESYQTVHQLVTTVRGVLRPDVSPVQCVRSAFPGGSMTGAPKLRTMEIIDEVEPVARGVYAGALGYFSHSGDVDLSIVIRTMVLTGNRLSIGIGGGVVAASEVDAERAEAELKAAALLSALRAACAAPDGEPGSGPRHEGHGPGRPCDGATGGSRHHSRSG
ncbi:anthranilate synthase component I family protein [Micromonospora sp. LOL_024]|uniref:anthranilate synthase component I family protein n=1 Tax=Micromonospora sp. LOL_024 TaxID=3345412 RepID=UPI003A8B86EC